MVTDETPFEEIFIWAPLVILFNRAGPFVQICKSHGETHCYETILNLHQSFSRWGDV